MRRTVSALTHVLAVSGLLVLAFLMLSVTAERDTWYHPTVDGDPSGYLIAAVEATVFIAAPIVVITYIVAVYVCHLLQRRQAVTTRPVARTSRR